METQQATEKSFPPAYNQITPTAPYNTTIVEKQPQTVIYVDNQDKICPECKQPNAMVYYDETSTRQHLWAVILCLTCWCCAWIPYVSNECMFRRGRCSRCGYATKDNTNNIGLKILIGVLVILLIIIVIMRAALAEKQERNYQSNYRHWN